MAENFRFFLFFSFSFSGRLLRDDFQILRTMKGGRFTEGLLEESFSLARID
jgi:hypothetical protein